jgi:hypothetical protein
MIFLILAKMSRSGIIIVLVMFLLIPGTLAPSCESEHGPIIPYVRVDEYLLLYADLADMGVGTTRLIEGGWKGLILYRESDLTFYAYDRTCTLYPDHDEAVVENPDFTGVFECPECGSSYLIINSAEPNSGPARHPLVQYHTSVQGDVLHISN